MGGPRLSQRLKLLKCIYYNASSYMVVLKSTPNVQKSPGSGLNLEGRLSDLQIVL